MKEMLSDWMTFKIQLLKNILTLYVQLGDMNFEIGEVRFAKCYFQEGLRLAEANLLTYWTSDILIKLGHVDLLCDNPKDCSIKLNGLKYIMNESSKEKAIWLLSKIGESKILDLSDTSEDFAIEDKKSVKFIRDMRQHFINNSDVQSSPIQKRKDKFPGIEFEEPSNLLKSLLSFYFLKIEMCVLSCLQLLSEGEVELPETQLNKLLKYCRNIKKLCTLPDRLFPTSINVSSKKIGSRSLTNAEIIVPIFILLKLSLICMKKNNFKGANNNIKEALKIFTETAEISKYIHCNLYAHLQYTNTISALKQILSLDGSSNVEYNICPFLKSNIFVRKNPKLEKLYVCQTPPKTITPEIMHKHLNVSNLCKAPVKKEVLPPHMVKDIKKIEASPKTVPLIFSSSDEDFSITNSKIDHLETTPIKNDKKMGKSYKLFKSKNSKVEIKSSGDIWKFSVTTTPKISKQQESALRKTKRETRSKTNPGKSIVKAPRKAQKQSSRLNNPCNLVDSIVLKNNLYSPFREPMSVECNRSSVEKKTREAVSDSNNILLETQLNACSSTPLVFESSDNTPETNSSSSLDELCQDINALNIETTNDGLDIYKNLPEQELEKFIDDLTEMKGLVEDNVPFSLYADICRLLAILLMAKKNKFGKVSNFQEVGFLLSQTMATTFGQVYLNNILYSRKKTGDVKEHLPLLKAKNSSSCEQIDQYLNPIPLDWTIVQINALPDKDAYIENIQKATYSKLVLTRFQNGIPPITICVDSSMTSRLISSLFLDFEDILLQSTLIMKNTDSSKKWWQTRSTLDLRLKSLLNSMENSWLGCWKSILLGSITNPLRKQQISQFMDTVSNIAKANDDRLLEIFLDSVSFLKREQISAFICHLWDCTPSDKSYSEIYKCIIEQTNFAPTERNPIVLLLDKSIQALPWESLPVLNGNPVSRMPSLSVLTTKLSMYNTDSNFFKGIDCRKTYYVLNPDGDLINSQETFEEKFKKQKHWKGIVAKAPHSLEYVEALKNHDLFLYCGHGSGRQYLTQTSINKLECNATAVLMGCSSGRLKQLGRRLEAHGFPLMYLMTGSPCVVANLWDVTDKDIDRFTDKFLELVVPNYSKKLDSLTDTDNAVSQARNACKMRYLVGAAPVIYVLPIFAQK